MCGNDSVFLGLARMLGIKNSLQSPLTKMSETFIKNSPTRVAEKTLKLC